MYASIDIGTNTLRLLVAEAGKDGFIVPVVYKRIITRLGGLFSEQKGIDLDSATRTIKALREFRRMVDERGVKEVFAVATSVVRRAKNREWFLEEVYRNTGFVVRVLSGEEEARLCVRGVLSVVGGDGRCLIMDIGGGSTEFIATADGRIKGIWSMDMGVVHLTERYLKSDPPGDYELREMESEISRTIDELTRSMTADGVEPDEYSGTGGAFLVGTAGTITTLAMLDQSLEEYDPVRINNYILSRDSICRLYTNLSGLTLKEREEVLVLEKGREDLIVAGSAISLIVADRFGFDGLRVSDSGLLEGILLDRLGMKGINYKQRTDLERGFRVWTI